MSIWDELGANAQADGEPALQVDPTRPIWPQHGHRGHAQRCPPGPAAQERLLHPPLAGQYGLLLLAARLHHGLDLLLDARGGFSRRSRAEHRKQRARKQAVRQRVPVVPGNLGGRLVVLRSGKHKRTAVFQRRRRHGVSGVARVECCPSLVISGLWAAGDATAMTTVEDERQRDSLPQQRAEESRLFLVPDVEYSGVG